MPSIHSEAIYLNDAATAWPKAPGVAEALCCAAGAVPCHPGRAACAERDPLTECRERLAALMQIDDHCRIALTPGGTHSLNMAILGLGMQRGDTVVTTVTEHNSVLRPLAHLRDRCGIRVIPIGLDADCSIDRGAFESALSLRPKLVAINHVSNVTGRPNEVVPLFTLAKRAGAVTLLDASQSLGRIPVHPTELGADLVAFTGHKALRGPEGTGGLYVAPGLELEQIFVGGTGVRSELELHPPEMPARLEAGTPNVAAFAGLAAALRWLEDNMNDFNDDLRARESELRSGLACIDGVRLFAGPADRCFGTGIASFSIDSWSVGDTGCILSDSYGILCRTGLHCAPLIHKPIGSAPQGTVRFSPSGFNTQEHISAALKAVKEMAA